MTNIKFNTDCSLDNKLVNVTFHTRLRKGMDVLTDDFCHNFLESLITKFYYPWCSTAQELR